MKTLVIILGMLVGAGAMAQETQKKGFARTEGGGTLLDLVDGTGGGRWGGTTEVGGVAMGGMLQAEGSRVGATLLDLVDRR